MGRASGVAFSCFVLQSGIAGAVQILLTIFSNLFAIFIFLFLFLFLFFPLHSISACLTQDPSLRFIPLDLIHISRMFWKPVKVEQSDIESEDFSFLIHRSLSSITSAHWESNRGIITWDFKFNSLLWCLLIPRSMISATAHVIATAKCTPKLRLRRKIKGIVVEDKLRRKCCLVTSM